jgi:hypothetical protein
MRSQLIVDAVIIPLVEEVQILVTQTREKLVRVVKLTNFPVPTLNAQSVRKAGLPGGDQSFEKAGLFKLLKSKPFIGIYVHHFAAPGILKVGSYNHPFGCGMHAKVLVRVVVPGPDYSLIGIFA